MQNVRSVMAGSNIQRGSHDSTASGSCGHSVSPTTSHTSLEEVFAFQETKEERFVELSGTLEQSNDEVNSTYPSPRTSVSALPCPKHIIRLSSIEHCMPRAYIRVCFAFRLPPDKTLDEEIKRLGGWVRKAVDAKPYLCGYVVPVSKGSPRMGEVEIQYTDQDFNDFPEVQIRDLSKEGITQNYDELDKLALPPSIIKPELVSALPEGTDDHLAPVFRMQANLIKGGLIVSIYLHHCISDGAGLGLLATGSVFEDNFTFKPYLDGNIEGKQYSMPSLSDRLGAFAKQKSHYREKLSWSSPNQINTRHIEYKRISHSYFPEKTDVARPPGRGCVVAFPKQTIASFKTKLEEHQSDEHITLNDVLQSLLWHSMTKARRSSITDPSIISSKLMIPVNIRNRVNENLPASYFGAAVDFASAQLSIAHLCTEEPDNVAAMAQTARTIRRAINEVDDQYIRQVIELANRSDPNIDVRDVMGSNMNRSTGADMYITSWEKLGLYNATFDMTLGKPDWVRKPWSKDPGSCIILPFDDRKADLEVVIQMTEVDMTRLLEDEYFKQFVTRIVD